MEAVASKRIKGILLDTTMDSPARSAWLSLRQFNGYSGCQTCTESGEQLDLGPGKKHARRQCHIYPINPKYAPTTRACKTENTTLSSSRLLLPRLKFPRKEGLLRVFLLHCTAFQYLLNIYTSLHIPCVKFMCIDLETAEKYLNSKC